MGFGDGSLAFDSTAYELKVGDDSSHARILSWLSEFPKSKILDLGCSDGELSARFGKLGHHVTGIDMEALDGVEDSVDRFIAADLDAGLPKETGTGYDIVIAADVLEHVRWPDKLLRDIALCLTPGGIVLASIPNFSHWYPRLRVAAGLFDYDRRGILDATHFRFFTRRSFDRLVEKTGFTVNRCEPFGLPLEVFGRNGPSLTNGDATSAKSASLGHRTRPSQRPECRHSSYPVRLPVPVRTRSPVG